MTFGAPGRNVTGEPSDDAAADALERSLSPVQVLTVRDALPITNARPPDPVVVSGDGFGIAAAARAGLLEGDPAVLYSGNLTPPSLGDLLASSQNSFIVTDTNRRWAWSFSGPRSPHSFTLTQDDTLGGRTIGYLLFDDRPSTQSVAVYPGMRSITASAYGGAFGTSPQYRPSNAFDDDPATLWLVGTGGDPTGSWIQGTFEQRRLLSRLSIQQPSAWYLREIRNVRVEFSDGSSVVRTLRRGGETSISFPSRMAAWVRVRILSVGPNPVAGRRAGSALADIQIPGLDPAEIVRVPNDLFETAERTESGVAALARSPLTYLFQRVRGYYAQDPDEEVRIVRRFTAAGSASYELSGTVRLNPSAPDEQLDQVLFGNQPVQASSSSRLLGNPALRGSSALDGDPSTSWVPRGAEGEWLTVRFPRHLVDTISVDTDRGPQWTVITRIRAVLPDGTQTTGDLADPTQGTIQIDLPPTVTNRVSLFVDRVFSPLAGSTNPVGINEVHIPGVAPLPGRRSSSLPCTFAGLTVDGRPIGVRPQGTVGDLVNEREVPLRACNNTLIRLNDGQHDLVAGGGLQPDNIMLTKQVPIEVPSATPTLPELSTVRHWDGSSEIRVTNAEGPFYLVLGQNYDRRWQASIDGHDLGPPTVVNGYSAGWRITRPGSFTVEVGYAQQRLYTYALGLTAVTLAVVAVLVAVSLVHRRRRRARRADAS
jgi:arabinofuranan 3-O-arabinosyltransferase